MGDEEQQKDDESKKPNTTRLNAKERRSYTIPRFTGYGNRFTPPSLEFKATPSNYETLDNDPWYVLFKFGEPAPQTTIGLAIYGDVILGRDPQNSKIPADIDLSEHKAQELGVSRNHAMLRPTSRNLFILDMNSTNGTYVNAIPIGQGMAHALKTGNTVALAGLIFEVEIKAMPGDPQPTLTEDDFKPMQSGTTLAHLLAGLSSQISESSFGVTSELMLPDDFDETAARKRNKKSRMKRLLDEDEE
jgi:pSer/pThr/pTyr-binding forkhead associated (FHA) protein